MLAFGKIHARHVYTRSLLFTIRAIFFIDLNKLVYKSKFLIKIINKH